MIPSRNRKSRSPHAARGAHRLQRPFAAHARSAAAVHARDPARGRRRVRARRRASRPSPAPARWSMSAASISPSSPSCWSRTSRCAPRGARSMPAWSALADALAVHAPPEKPITFDWPDAIRVDGGLVGGARLAWPKDAAGGRAAGLAGVRRHDPHRVDGRGRAGPASAVGGARGGRLRRFRRRPRWSESFARHLMVADRRLAGVRLWRGREELSGAACAAKGRAPRHRRQRRSAGAARRQGRRSSARSLNAALARGRRHGSIRKTARAAHDEAAAHHPARSLRHVRVRARGRARRMGGVGRLHVLRTPIRRTLEGKARAAFRGGFLGVASLGWSTLVQIVEASDDDRAAAVDMLARRLLAHFGAPDLAEAPRRGGGGGRVRGFALRSSARHADRGASHATRMAKSARHSAPCARADAQADARVRLPRRRRRGRAGEAVDLVNLAKERGQKQ